MKKIIAILIIPVLILITGGCYSEKADLLYGTACNTDNVTYSKTIKPILTLNCVMSGCHDIATSSNAVELETVGGAQAVAYNHKLLDVINHTSAFPMPKDRAALDACTIQKITIWVNAGAPDN